MRICGNRKNCGSPFTACSYASIGAVLMNKRVAEGVRGLWKHGHTYQAQPLSCAASLAVQKVFKEEKLIENCRVQGEYLGTSSWPKEIARLS